MAKNLENICWVGITQLAYGDRSRNRTHDYRQTQVQFDFRDRLEPVYREFTDLLLTTKDNTQPSQENLGRAIKAIDALQIAELENYLGCNLSELIELDETTFDPTAVRIYPIILSERLVTIVDILGQPLSFTEIQVSSSEIKTTLIALQMVLSACETAKGDNRAVLGLAGLTVRTGARTTLSTLWRADDRATTLLMTEFYQQLARPETTKAEALRQAQLSPIDEEGYFAPYYWGTYLLVGNWL